LLEVYRRASYATPAAPIAIARGGIRFPLQVLSGSPIKTLTTFKGKTVLAAVGSDPPLVRILMWQGQFGTDDPKRS
jgi:hypothetical protein